MLKSSEIFLETIKVDGKPERLLKRSEGATFFPPNPANKDVRGNRHRGMEPMKDLFGTEILLATGTAGSHASCYRKQQSY